ncbi:MAG: glycoside hydrolase family 3 C-terminal domain-containing protein [Bryobacterales bacterium]|nr:glycoside hydrolase family 3 C-terminal domain-containing protein [Bryobacteraceae bacterium]MDW8129676.1 glycoside hydrolase family 3 C-terminal domain-containing protein [Bryobacterales bacterium]
MGKKGARLMWLAAMLAGASVPLRQQPVYLDSRQPIERRVEDLLGRMTLEEKVGQMNMPCVYRAEMGGGATNTGETVLRYVEVKKESCRRFAEGTHLPGLGPGGGFFTLADNVLPGGPRQQAEFFNELQRIALTRTRLKIPLLQIEEGTHGLMCSGGTVFPEGPALGSTWNVDLLERVYAAAAHEARAVGIHALFTLVIEPIRDPRMGRNQEAYSEDPYLTARIAEAIVRGAQGDDVARPDKVVAGLCHYPGQSQPVSGLERGAMEISERTLREVFLPPWVAGIRKRGALGVMATYPAIDGVAAHASEKLLTRILREELGFRGLVFAEGMGLTTIIQERHAADQGQAGLLALTAGVDVGISYEPAFMLELIEGVRKGRVPLELVDRAVRRILWLKFRLGLFERPYVDVEEAVRGVPREEHRRLALQAAREGIVLLKNQGNLLPLDPRAIRTIAVIGPNAHDERNQLGDYTSKIILQDIVTVLEGIRARLGPHARVLHVKGCNVTGEELNQIREAQEAARQAQVAVVVVGESRQTNGEGRDAVSLDLTGLQEDLIKAVHATGTPTVVVLINGRPLSIRWVAEHVPAIVEAWLPGEQGGRAVAEVLFGDVNPTGRLPVTVPRHVGQLPVYYNHTATKAARMKGRGYVDMEATPLWEFGYGLSYTRFEYRDLRIHPAVIPRDGSVKVGLKVRNAGPRAGAEVVQLYLNDLISTVSRPLKELRGFVKVWLEPGEEREVVFTLGPEELSLLDQNLRWTVEPGDFEVLIGASSEDIRLRGRFTVQ